MQQEQQYQATQRLTEFERVETPSGIIHYVVAGDWSGDVATLSPHQAMRLQTWLNGLNTQIAHDMSMQATRLHAWLASNTVKEEK